jgi:hypothetical protein
MRKITKVLKYSSDSISYLSKFSPLTPQRTVRAAVKGLGEGWDFSER